MSGPMKELMTPVIVRSYSPTCGGDLGRRGDEQLGVALAGERDDALLVLVVARRPEQAHGQRLGAAVGEPRERLRRRLLVEPDDDLALEVDALGHLGDERACDELLGLVGVRHVEQAVAVQAGEPARALHDRDRVAVAVRGDQADLRALAA